MQKFDLNVTQTQTIIPKDQSFQINEQMAKAACVSTNYKQKSIKKLYLIIKL
jgi:hypothetical protein